MKKIFIPLFFITAIILSAGCESPASFKKRIPISVSMPQWPPEHNYPKLINWKITAVSDSETRSFYAKPEDNEITLEVFKDCLTSIFVQPVTESIPQDFFCPAACVYPVNFDDSKAVAQWDKYPLANIASSIFSLENSPQKQNAIYYFNWNKLDETLTQKQQDSFEKYDSKKTKNCTTGFNTDMETAIERILNPPSRFYVPYFETSCLPPEKIKLLDLSADDVILNSYIPLNELYKEKGCLTIQTSPSNHKTAFLLNDNYVYIMNKCLYVN